MHSELYHLGEKAECNYYHVCGGEGDGLRKHTTRILPRDGEHTDYAYPQEARPPCGSQTSSSSRRARGAGGEACRSLDAGSPRHRDFQTKLQYSSAITQSPPPPRAPSPVTTASGPSPCVGFAHYRHLSPTTHPPILVPLC